MPEEMVKEGRYLAAETVGDVWCCYPWEAMYVLFFPRARFCALRNSSYANIIFLTSDIDEHDQLAAAGEATAQKNGTNGTNH